MPDRRVEPRMLCADVVKVRWTDDNGRKRTASALLEDICRFGACLQLERPLPVFASLRIEHPQATLEGTVRYCVYREIGYFTGVEFTPASEWSRQQFEPRHLVDLQELVRKAQSRG